MIALFMTLTLLIFMLHAGRMSHILTILEQLFSSPSCLSIQSEIIRFVPQTVEFLITWTVIHHLSRWILDTFRFHSVVVEFSWSDVPWIFNAHLSWLILKFNEKSIFEGISLNQPQKRKSIYSILAKIISSNETNVLSFPIVITSKVTIDSI